MQSRHRQMESTSLMRVVVLEQEVEAEEVDGKLMPRVAAHWSRKSRKGST